jgi:glutamate formiminotransferase/glutamate formiminotransferase/formiminotetrahydrofolate cyclodeaminase
MELLAIPNVSEGRDRAVIDAIARAFASTGARLLDVHADGDHHRSVYTLAGGPGQLATALAAGAREVLARVDLRAERGAHPHVGALDVAPIVHLDDARRGAACAEALLAADLLGELGLPVFLYGLLGGDRTRAELRRGGVRELRERVRRGELRPDFGPAEIGLAHGATLVAARPPLVAFNLELAPPATVEDARRIAALVREGGPDGLPGVRAIGVELHPAAWGGGPGGAGAGSAGGGPGGAAAGSVGGGHGGATAASGSQAPADDRPIAQVSTNVEDHRAVPLAALLAAVERHAPVACAELVGLAPAAAFAGWPEDRVPIRNRRTVEEALAASAASRA